MAEALDKSIEVLSVWSSQQDDWSLPLSTHHNQKVTETFTLVVWHPLTGLSEEKINIMQVSFWMLEMNLCALNTFCSCHKALQIQTIPYLDYYVSCSNEATVGINTLNAF